MSRAIPFAVFGVALVVCSLATALGDEKEDSSKKPAIVVSPKAGAKVGESEEVEGKLNVAGWPVVLVKPQVGDLDWWIQEPVEEMDKGVFTVRCHFGDEKTTAGTEFKIVIVVAKTKAEASKLERGKTRRSLPAGLPHSEPVTVARG